MELNLLSALLLLALLCLALLPFAVPGVLEVLLALAIGAFASSALVWLGWLPQDWSLVLLSLAMLTAVSAVLLWKPLRKLQKTGIRLQENNAISDFVGTELTLTENASKDTDSHIQFCGVDWRLRLDPEEKMAELSAGQVVVITSAAVGLLTVRSKIT